LPWVEGARRPLTWPTSARSALSPVSPGAADWGGRGPPGSQPVRWSCFPALGTPPPVGTGRFSASVKASSSSPTALDAKPRRRSGHPRPRRRPRHTPAGRGGRSPGHFSPRTIELGSYPWHQAAAANSSPWQVNGCGRPAGPRSAPSAPIPPGAATASPPGLNRRRRRGRHHRQGRCAVSCTPSPRNVTAIRLYKELGFTHRRDNPVPSCSGEQAPGESGRRGGTGAAAPRLRMMRPAGPRSWCDSGLTGAGFSPAPEMERRRSAIARGTWTARAYRTRWSTARTGRASAVSWLTGWPVHPRGAAHRGPGPRRRPPSSSPTSTTWPQARRLSRCRVEWAGDVTMVTALGLLAGPPSSPTGSA